MINNDLSLLEISNQDLIDQERKIINKTLELIGEEPDEEIEITPQTNHTLNKTNDIKAYRREYMNQYNKRPERAEYFKIQADRLRNSPEKKLIQRRSQMKPYYCEVCDYHGGFSNRFNHMKTQKHIRNVELSKKTEECDQLCNLCKTALTIS